MSRFNIGIDTGGTYTDAVVVDLQHRQVLASAKAHTTHGDLSIGVAEALSAVLASAGKQVARGDVSLVSVSTTLATNALVEGQGAPVACLLIGFDDAMALRSRVLEPVPNAELRRIAGGHTHSGEEREALDEQAIRDAVTALGDSVQGYAVGAQYSVRNPAHELRAAEIIREMSDAPVTLSCDLSAELDGPRRALTATLNASIVSRIVDLVVAVRKCLQQEGIGARLMIVRGDGSLANADLVVEKPIETILSGPAASVIGARYLTGLGDFIISDIGGTTTDIATAHGGWPAVNRRGSMVGPYRTLVHAIDMQTWGLGGDSEVRTDYQGNIVLSTRRVVPVSMLGRRWPDVTHYLRAEFRAGRRSRSACRFVLHPEGYDTAKIPADLPGEEKALLQRTADEPQPWAAVVRRKADEAILERLVSRGLLQIAGFTPSDAAHALGRQQNWDVETARMACEIQGLYCGRISQNRDRLEEELEAFAQGVLDAVVQKSCHLLIERLAGQAFADDDPLVGSVTSGTARVNDLGVSLSPTIPVVAVGGPAPLYYPEVGRRLNAQTVIPEHSAVANAVGAAVGLVRAHARIEINVRDEGGYIVHGPATPEIRASAAEAIELAESLAVGVAESQATAMGAIDVVTTTEIDRVVLPDSDDDLGLVAATVTAESTGSL